MAISAVIADMEKRLVLSDAAAAARKAGAALGRARRYGRTPEEIGRLVAELEAARRVLAEAKATR